MSAIYAQPVCCYTVIHRWTEKFQCVETFFKTTKAVTTQMFCCCHRLLLYACVFPSLPQHEHSTHTGHCAQAPQSRTAHPTSKSSQCMLSIVFFVFILLRCSSATRDAQASRRRRGSVRHSHHMPQRCMPQVRLYHQCEGRAGVRRVLHGARIRVSRVRRLSHQRRRRRCLVAQGDPSQDAVQRRAKKTLRSDGAQGEASCKQVARPGRTQE